VAPQARPELALERLPRLRIDGLCAQPYSVMKPDGFQAYPAVEPCARKAILPIMLTSLASRPLTDRLPNRVVEHLQAFRREVEHAMPQGVTRVVLFGSRARGDARRNSDYDVAVFVRNLEDRRTVDHALADIAYKHILQGVHIRPVAVPADYLESRPNDTLALNLSREGILIP
jgi:predicted nucleotidyltransferase